MSVPGLTIIGTCPAFHFSWSASEYLQRVRTAALQAEAQGWTSVLVYSDHRQVDPWVVAQLILGMTTKLTPLLALQPLYMHPFTAAKAIASLSFLYDRPVNINFVSGGLPRDLETFCDPVAHDQRYDRIVEYGSIMKHILLEKTPLTHQGKFYQVRSLQLQPWPALKPHCVPMLTMSGSSSAGLAAARKLGARAIQYLKPHRDYTNATFPPELQYGARVGIIARPKTEEAWQVAHQRYPADETGAELRKYFAKATDSVWVKELSQMIPVGHGHPYWLGPYQHSQASCPFLVGDMGAVAAELAGYIRMGLRTFLVENPVSDEDATYVTQAFRLAGTLANYGAEASARADQVTQG